ncbi:MAG: ATP-binding cassette domain-containing protein [Acidobacteria bacterium]|nr:ATP-binding cassette domain-containing protein [Acidobacteriota bacterium]
MWTSLIAGDESSSFGLAAFLVAFATFGQLAAGVTGLSAAATAVVALVPLFERVKPLLEAEPETAGDRTDPGDLTGDIELRDVHFRYLADGGDVLDGVSLRIRPGDYVAIVGPSGSGKSTIFRLLFGFEHPDSGAVLFDGHDLLNLDPEAVRRHLGVVLQDGQVAADTIRNNVAGSSRLTPDEVWDAVRAAGLEDDVRAMPMGLHTMLHEGGGGLSGGQRQRLLIARALARKPRVLLLDEATSALDNHTQSNVQDALGKLSITRIVIAHRLSTVRDVDRIHVLDRGRIAESGRYDDLLARDGVFAELAKRQLI